jgi:hypothetical protein
LGDVLTEIREIYARWLDGSLSSEDTLFSIGDVLEAASLIVEAPPPCPPAESARKRDA